MPEQKKPASSKPVEEATAAPGERRSVSPPPRKLAKASESGDPAIQKLLADRNTAEMNAATAAGDSAQSEAVAKAHQQHIADRNKDLADLGFE
ncbi:MAG TPA: hypothetical protein VNH17_17255 [Streptosporangiaceae bacterium]|nr:hypothetical protein [Streptosporangiaceae bacterium]